LKVEFNSENFHHSIGKNGKKTQKGYFTAWCIKTDLFGSYKIQDLRDDKDARLNICLPYDPQFLDFTRLVILYFNDLIFN